MPTINVTSADIWQRVKKPTGGWTEREDLRQAIVELSEEQALQITPEEGESLRRLKVMSRWAAKEVGREIQYAELDGDLVVKLKAPPVPGAPKRGRPRRERLEPGEGFPPGFRFPEPDKPS